MEVQWNLFSFYAIIVKSSKMGQPKSTKETVYGDQKVNVAACCFFGDGLDINVTWVVVFSNEI